MSILDSLFNNISAINNTAKGVKITPAPARLGDVITINYDGLLAKDGADQVYLHMGYGMEWNGTQDIPMEKTSKGWACEIVPQDFELNFCFHDSANNWDNNNGENWSISLT